ncbi:MAG: NUDIX hydrolase [Acidimicrobiales bacterium]|jgi:8-oxo-dGTP diphosphatase
MSTDAPPPRGDIPPASGDGADLVTEPTGRGPAAAGVVRAAGGIVIRASSAGGWEVALIHRPLQQDWSLPKGKLDAGESAEECALREVLEETGWKCALGRFAGEVEYVDRRGRPKVVEYWLMQPIEGGYDRYEEVDELAWVPIAEAPGRLTYEHDGALVASVASAMTVPGFHFDG